MVRISQCMIVKNEEQNIARALTWGKGVVCEQIVVDTGSTDRTVEIAESMGAKVLHFEWIKDYSAAKNFAIEAASGDWIAFLDADEYFTEEDAKNLKEFLESIHADETLREKYLAVFCPWVQLRDDGSIMSVDKQMRIFRNLPDIRYIGRIHEWLDVDWAYAVTTEDFSIMHTGYTEEAYKKTNKAYTNIELIRLEIIDKPNDMNFPAYLADSLMADAQYGDYSDSEREAMRAEAKELYLKVALCDSFVLSSLKKRVYERVLDEYVLCPDFSPEYEKAASMAISEYPDDHIIMCCYAGVLNKSGDYKAAFEILKKCEQSLSIDKSKESGTVPAIMERLSTQMILAAQGLGDIDTLITYAGIRLMTDKTNKGILYPYIHTLMKRYASVGDAMKIINEVYDFSDINDKMTVARAAKETGAIELAKAVIDN